MREEVEVEWVRKGEGKEDKDGTCKERLPALGPDCSGDSKFNTFSFRTFNLGFALAFSAVSSLSTPAPWCGLYSRVSCSLGFSTLPSFYSVFLPFALSTTGVNRFVQILIYTHIFVFLRSFFGFTSVPGYMFCV